MKKLFLLLLCYYCCLPAANCQQPYWQQQVNYMIDVTLNDADHTLDGYVKMEYCNNSPDTLRFIWIHVWPNAYKNDRTALTDQLLENGSTDFYFSSFDKRGYINRLDFKVNGIAVEMEDHPEHQDIIKIILPAPLLPKSSAKIETGFHVKLPFNFSRGGHVDKSYQITQWYPKPAVYDHKGWHPMPYLDQGEFYSEFGNYEVHITVPEAYTVASTGEFQSESKNDAIDTRKPAATKKPVRPPAPTKKKKNLPVKKEVALPTLVISKYTKTLIYKQDNVHDFAWFADKRFIVQKDSLRLASGRVIKINAYSLPATNKYWKNSLAFIKQSVITRSQWLGEYPYNTVSVVEAPLSWDGGMEYPTITSISPAKSETDLESIIVHEVGHNWNYGILATNEREHPWMDEGINTYYEERYYTEGKNTSKPEKKKNTFQSKRLPEDTKPLVLNMLIASKKDQPIATSSTSFSVKNYYTVAYLKTALWMKQLETDLGQKLFDSCMHEYYRRWQFRHPYPEDFKKVMEEVSGKNLDTAFSLLAARGKLPGKKVAKKLKLTTFFNLKETDKYNYLSIAPAVGYNFYDNLMAGILVHNYSLPEHRLQFLFAPMYATGSKQLNGLGRMSLTLGRGYYGGKLELAVAGATFSGDSYKDSTGKTDYWRFSKIVPSLKYVFPNRNARSTTTKFIQWKTFLIAEQEYSSITDTATQVTTVSFPSKNRYLNQLRFVIDNKRTLYPYHGDLQVEQAEGFVRAAVTLNYFFNYAKEGGMNVRLFAGKFFYTGDEFFSDRYQLNMTGANGYEDYTYSNYFIGRNEFEKYSSQQIMIKDGAFKVRSDLLSAKIGKTDNWLGAINFTSDIPKNINPLQVLPVKIPLKLFLDIGTYAEAWKKDAPTSRFIYDAGLQVSVWKNVLNIYIPILYSKVYSDYFKSTITEKRFLKNISFSIDIDNLTFKKIAPELAF